jgi:GH35 family endo-1,4-beta-xylanase
MAIDTDSSAGWDPYSRSDPGPGIQRLPAAEPEITPKSVCAWKKWRTNDGRILPDTKSSFEYIDNPFEGEIGNLVKLITYFDPVTAGRSFGGFGIRAPLSGSVEVNTSDTFIEFDLYYPFSAAGKYMRMEFWSTDTGGENSQAGSGSNGKNKATVYIRTESLDAIGNLNPDWVAHYNGETWSKKNFSINSQSNGIWNFINIDINTETGATVDGDILFIGGVRITKLDPNGVHIPDVVDAEHFSAVMPIKEKYNKENGLFMVGAKGTGKITGLRERHYEIFVDGNNLKAVHVHPIAPQWLKDETGFNFADPPASDGELREYNFPTDSYLQIRDSGKPGEFKCHGHVLAWYNQGSIWMRQIIPEHLGMTWNKEGKFYAYGNNAAGPFVKVNKALARRVYFNHIMYVMRHFMTVDAKYGSNAVRGIIPFHSFDVLNEEIHESRHSTLIRDNPDEWKSGLKSISWLAAMSDNDFDDLTQHYIYLLFKYAHIAIPNSQMAARFKANYASLPEYMKLDGHDDNGSIDAYITENPPHLTYNDYGITSYTKAKMSWNMIKELNTAWLSDPLYDGRPLIEVMGIQGHDSIGPSLASDNARAIELFAELIDQGLLSKIAYSELDLKLSHSAPGGGALAPDILNQKQADALGYQYALLYSVFAKYAKYIDHIISWGTSGSGWQNSYVLFNGSQDANQGYYGVMDPNRFIMGHSYLDEYFVKP